jgi:protein ImuA
MSQGGVSERILFLRRSIAALEAAAGSERARFAAGGEPGSARDLLERLFDASSVGASEIVPARARDAASAAGFAFALAMRCAVRRPQAGVVWIAEDMIAREIGLPYGRGLQAAGLSPERLVLVRTRRPQDTFWAMEEALKSRAAAVVAESFASAKAYDLTVSRRLALAARRSGGAGLLLLPRLAGEAARATSAAQARFEIASRFIQRADAAPRRLPLPGLLAWRVRIVKARAGLVGGGDFDPQSWRDIVFDHERAEFGHALPRRVPASPVDRPDPSAAADEKWRESA